MACFVAVDVLCNDAALSKTAQQVRHQAVK